MGTRFRFLAGVVLPGLLLSLSACTTSSSSTPTGSGPGALFVATQGDSSVSAYTIDLSTGTLNANGDSVPTGSVPVAMIASPSGTALFVANSGTNDISAYTVTTDGTLTPASGTTPTGGMTPLSMAMDAGGHFLFVANQGLQIDPASGTVSVFAVQDATLTAVPGSPFRVAELGASSGTGPAGVAVTPDGKFLYVSDQFDSTVTTFSVDASGLLTRGPVVAVGTAPSALAITRERRLSVCRQFKHGIGLRDLQPGCEHLQRSHYSGRHSHTAHGLALLFGARTGVHRRRTVGEIPVRG